MRIPNYLVRSKSGIFHFRLKVPLALRSTLNLSVIKRSLHTHERARAQIFALALASSYYKAWRNEGFALKDEDILAIGAESLQNRRNNSGFEISFNSTGGIHSIKTDGTAADNAAANKAIATTMATKTEPKKSQVSLNVFAEKWILRLEASNPKIKTKAAKSRAIFGFVKWKGAGFAIGELIPADFADYAVFLRSDAGGGLSLSYAKDQLMYLTMWMESAIKHNIYSGSNPAKGHIMYPKSAKDLQTTKTGWQPFSAAQLAAIFDPENFSKIGQEHTRWGLILALYTGARISELAQLALADFEQDSKNRWIIKIDTIEEKQSLKTADSRRILPIHKDLINLGLIERVERLKAVGETMLFPKLKSGGNGYGGAVSHGISRYLAKLEIKPRGGGKLGAHSFRVGLIQVLEDAIAIVSDGESRMYCGHSLTADAHSGYQAKARAVSAREHVKTKHNVFNVLKALPAKAWTLDLKALKQVL